MRLALLVAGFFLFSSVVFGQDGPPLLIPERKTMKTRDGNAPPPERVTAPTTPADGEDDEEDEPIDCGDDPINRIRFIGNLGGFSEEQLFEAMPDFSRFRASASGYCERVFEERDLPRLKAFFNKSGFPETEIKIPHNQEPEPGELLVRINARRPCVVGTVTAFGFDGVAYDQVVACLRAGEPVAINSKTAKGEDVRDRAESEIRELFREAGFPKTEVAIFPDFTGVENGNGMEVVNFEIHIEKEPSDFTVRTVEFNGDNVTLDRVVRRELYLGEGELFRQYLLDRSLTALRRLGLFSDVRVTSIDFDKRNRTVDITISVTETAETVRKAKTEQEQQP